MALSRCRLQQMAIAGPTAFRRSLQPLRGRAVIALAAMLQGSTTTENNRRGVLHKGCLLLGHAAW